MIRKSGIILVLVLLVPMTTVGLAYSGARNRQNSLANVTHPPIEISGNSDFAGQASMEGWPGNGSESDPYVINGLNITSGDYVECIHIEDVSVFFEISDCVMTSIPEYSSCIHFYEVSNALVESCTISSPVDSLMLGRVHDSIIRNNVVYGRRTAVLLWETTRCSFVSNTFYDGGVTLWPMDETELRNEFLNNTVRGGKLGYFLNVTDSTIDATPMTQVIMASCRNVVVKNGNSFDIDCGLSIFYCSNCTFEGFSVVATNWGVHVMFSNGTRILESEISGTRFAGILVNSSFDCVVHGNEIYDGEYTGIELSESPNASIIDNEIRGYRTGVNVYWTYHGMVVNNLVTKNQEYGVRLHDNVRNYTLFNNTFALNLQSNGRDDGVGNVWDDGVSIGNAWDDYAGSGIYVVSGAAGSVDRFPRVPNETSLDYKPLISHPEDMTVVFGSVGNTITWNVIARKPASYSVMRNELVILSETWNGFPVTVSIDGLPPGYFNFTLSVADREGDSSSDSVIVQVYTVTDSTLTTNSTTSIITDGLETLIGQTLAIGVVSVIVILVVLVVGTKPENASMGWGT